MAKDKIYIQQWLDYHPYEKPAKSDFYYLKICNEINDKLESVEELLFRRDANIQRKELSILITCYFEDLVSEFGLWNAFIQNHRRLYGKYLPFYFDKDKDYIIFFNKNKGLEIINYAEYIPDANNPCFNPDKQPVGVSDMMFDNSISKDFIIYILNNYQISLRIFGGDDHDALLMNNLDFLLRFFKKEGYHSPPQINLV